MKNTHLVYVQLKIITIDGSITKVTTPFEVDPSVSVLSMKLLVQARDPIPPRERHTPPLINNFMDDTTLHPDFSRMFCNGVELEEDQKTLEESGVVDGDTIRFAVSASLAEDLRKCLSALIKKYPEDEITNTSDDDKRDDMILSFFLDLDLQRGLEIEADSLRIEKAFERGEGFTPPAEKNKNWLGSDEVEKELYKIFDPKVLPVRLYQLTKADGKSQYIGFAVEAKKTNYRYKACYGIPVTVLHSDRIKQSAVQAGPIAGILQLKDL